MTNERIRFRDVHADDLPQVLDLLLEQLGLQLWQESTPDYTAYEVRPAKDRATSPTQSQSKENS